MAEAPLEAAEASREAEAGEEAEFHHPMEAVWYRRPKAVRRKPWPEMQQAKVTRQIDWC